MAHSAGFTLIELLVALLLFALISLAGVSLVETAIRMQRSTAGRAEHLADVQRALTLITADFEQLASGPTRAAGEVSFTRVSGNGERAVRYWSDRAGFHRSADGTDHLILPGVTSVDWRFARHGAWTDLPATPDDATRPQAVELTLHIQTGPTNPGQLPTGAAANSPAGIGGTLRRVIELPAEQ